MHFSNIAININIYQIYDFGSILTDSDNEDDYIMVETTIQNLISLSETPIWWYMPHYCPFVSGRTFVFII